MKAQLMTISVLVLFILMLAELIIFITLSTGYNSLSQSYTQQANLVNYKSSLASSSRAFAAAALKTAIFELASYETTLNYSNPIYGYTGDRGTDLITNASLYISDSIKGKNLPNQGRYMIYNDSGITGYTYNANMLGLPVSLTFFAFNRSIESTSLYGVSNIVINETTPIIYQTSPYNISVRYTEYLELNDSGITYNYIIPVNATIPLNGTPDLYYAQQGVLRYIHFANVASLVNNVGNSKALNGTSSLFAYGTVLDYGSNAVCPNSNTLVSQHIIFATDNAQNINCNGSNFGGIISYTSPSASPANYVAYLNYPLSSNFISNSLTTGQSVLLYGPSSSTLSIGNLRSAIANGYYFASPFAPSYLDRAVGDFGKSSTNGIFTFTGYSRQVAYLDSNSYISGNSISVSNMTNFEWVYITSNQSFGPIAGFDGASSGTGFYNISVDNGNIVVWNGANKYVSSLRVPMYTWSFIGFSLNKTEIRVYDNGKSQLFSGLSNPSTNANNQDWIIGAQLGNTNHYTNMEISNVQAYGDILTPQQAYREYQGGIGELPIATGNNILWMPLNNNTYDYSGAGYYAYFLGGSGTEHFVTGHNGVPNSVYYNFPTNYNRDSALIVPSAQPTFPIPGMFACGNYQQCANTTGPHLYLADMPLEYGPELVAEYNPSVSSMVVTQQLNGTPLTKSNAFTLSAWVYGYGPTVGGETLANSSSNNNNGGFDFLFSKIGNGQSDYVLSVAPCCNNRVSWPNGVDSFPLNKWEMVTGEYDPVSGIANVYLNGTLFASKNIGRGLTAGQLLPLYLGSNSVSGGISSIFNGLMSDVQVYNQSLSQNQIISLYSEGISGSPIIGNSLIAWYPLNGNANDYSGNNNNGVSYNMTYTPITGYAQTGSTTPTAVSGEWQALGFGASPMQDIYWNVTEWSSANGIIPYSSVTLSPALPQGVSVYTSNIAGWYGIPTYRNNANGLPGFTGWAYESNTIANRQIMLMNAVPFPTPFNGLNSAISCGEGIGYTATANLTLTGTYTINVETTGATQAFYTLRGSGIWNPVLASGAWSANNDKTYSGSFTLTPGAYQFAVDYESSCGTGISAFSMSYG